MSAASVQTRLASLNIGKSTLSPLKPPTPSPLVAELLRKNNEQHDIFFGKNHFHNHYPHTLLSQFALGAPEYRLKKEWEIEDYLSPLGEKQPTEITDDNWKEYIGIDKFYHNYRDYFNRKIEKDGAQKTLVRYALDETLLPSFVSGAVHPMIHTGFGVEFSFDLVVAEGLAEGCVHKPAFAPVVDVGLYSQSSTGKKSLLEIVDKIHHDKSFNGIVKFTDGSKSSAFFESKVASEKVKEYVMKWSFDSSPEGVATASTELFELVTRLLVTSAFPPPHIVKDPKYKDKTLPPQLDFFLVHTVTATYGLRSILPFVPAEKQSLLLRVGLAVGLVYYIARGRPLLQPSELPETSYSWSQIAEKTWGNEDLHVPKVIRSLKVMSERGEMNDALARNGAGLIVQEMIDNGKSWSFLGHGFDEAWEKVANDN